MQNFQYFLIYKILHSLNMTLEVTIGHHLFDYEVYNFEIVLEFHDIKNTE